MIINAERGIATFGTRDLFEKELLNFGNITVPLHIDKLVATLLIKDREELFREMQILSGASRLDKQNDSR